MKREDIIRKLTSRKFWLAVAAFVTELIVVFRGGAELAESVTAIIIAGATVIAYIVGEGLIDAEAKDDGMSPQLALYSYNIIKILRLSLTNYQRQKSPI